MLFAQGVMARVMAALDGAERAAASSYEYREARAEVRDLRAAVEAAIRQDDSEASGFWVELSRLGRHTVNFFSERQRFNEQAARTKAAAMTALELVEQFFENNVAKHAGVPAALEADAERWNANANKVRGLQNSAVRLLGVEGWDGDARVEYSTAVKVQVNALSELRGVMRSAGTGADMGAALNRAIFYVMGKKVRLTTNRIRSAPGSSGDQYYLRTAKAANECDALLIELLGALLGDVAEGSANTLRSELTRTVSLPNLLQEGAWPTGTGAANTSPADTGDGVSQEVDVDLGSSAGSSGGRSGVDL